MYTLRIKLEIDPLVLAEVTDLSLDDIHAALKLEPVDVSVAEAIVDACNQLRTRGHAHVSTLDNLFTFCPCPFYS